MRISRVGLSVALLTAVLSPAPALGEDCGALVGKTFLADQGTPPLNFSEKRADGFYLNQEIPPGQKFLITALNPVHYGADTYTVLTRDGRQLTITCSELQSALDATYPTQHVRKGAPDDFSGAQAIFEAKQNAANAEAAQKAAEAQAELQAKIEADQAELQRRRDEETRAHQDSLVREAKRKKQEQQERADALKYREQRIARGGVRIGMSELQVLASSWGEPEKRNHTLTALGDSEQWVYRDQYFLYFVNGVLTGVQTDSPDSGYFQVMH